MERERDGEPVVAADWAGPGPPVDAVSERRAAEIIEEYESEAPTRQLAGLTGWIVGTLAIGLSLYALYWVVGIVQPQIYRVSFLLVALVLTFLVYPFARSQHRRVHTFDWLLAVLAV